MTPEALAAERLAADLRALGVRPRGYLLAHSSLSALGRVPGGAESVIRGLLAAVGDEGTLLLPALSYETVTPTHPVFDVARTPSNVGIIPETFRTRAGTRRSEHPTHSVCAVGPRAEALLAGHAADDTPCGAHSPWRAMRDHAGQLLFLGCGLDANTSMHGVEELAEPPYLFGPPVDYRITRASGETVPRRCRPHGFANVEQRYDRAAPLLDAAGAIRRGATLGGTSLLVEAAPLWDLARAALQRDAWYFVDRNAPQS